MWLPTISSVNSVRQKAPCNGIELQQQADNRRRPNLSWHSVHGSGASPQPARLCAGSRCSITFPDTPSCDDMEPAVVGQRTRLASLSNDLIAAILALVPLRER